MTPQEALPPVEPVEPLAWLSAWRAQAQQALDVGALDTLHAVTSPATIRRLLHTLDQLELPQVRTAAPGEPFPSPDPAPQPELPPARAEGEEAPPRPVPAGHVRWVVECSTCHKEYRHEFVPYSVSAKTLTPACGHDGGRPLLNWASLVRVEHPESLQGAELPPEPVGAV